MASRATSFLVSICFFASSVAATAVPQQPTQPGYDVTSPPATDETDNGWPREIKDGDTLTIFQPQVESWKANQIVERAAVSVQTKASPEPTYGVIWLQARTEVDKANHLVTLEDVQITRADFPSAPEMKTTYLARLRTRLPGLVKQIALDRLQANLAVTQAEEKTGTPNIRNSPPQIIYSKTPAVLVLIDGEPELRDSGVPSILRVINTRSLMVLDQSSGKYYLYLGDRWMQSQAAKGPWTPAAQAPATLEKVKQVAVEQKQVDLLNDPQSSLMQGLRSGIIPTVYVATNPAELIQTQGEPQLQPIAGTRLLFVENSPDTIFVNTVDANYYVLISGRWYRSKSFNGPWDNVSPKKLPTDFAKIPETHRKATALASVSGTPQAQEAGIANDIPQTATVDRSQAALTVLYDGSPEFKPITGTPLLYAFNTATPVIEVDPNTYYAVQNAVWFAATSPQGPWVVATSVPTIIYTIPPSSPLYYVTYVRIYGSDSNVVYMGYTPGYLGSYYYDGVLVYGTGYVYRPWIGTVWYGAPFTYGFGWCWGPGFGWGFTAGFFTGVGIFAGAAFFPWWGPWRGWGYGWGPGAHVTNITINHFNVNHANVYRSWSRSAVRNSFERNEFANRGRSSYPSRPNNVYAGRNGEVYRYNNNGNRGWEQNAGHGWQNVPQNRVQTSPQRATSPEQNYRPPDSNTAARGPTSELEQNRSARDTGEQRWNSFRSGEAGHVAAPSAPSRHFAAPSGGRGGGHHG